MGARTLVRGAFHTLTVADVEPLCEDAAAVTFDVPESLRADYDFAAGQSLTLRRWVDDVEQRRSYSICAPVGERPQIGVREIPDGLFSAWLVREVRPGDRIEVQTPTGGFRADPTRAERHLCLAAGSGITPMLSIAASVLRHPGARLTLVYGNRTTGSVMFGDALADLKNRYGPRLDLIHVLSREPRDVELFSGRLDTPRLSRILRALVPIDDLDHAWLCGPFGMIADARTALADLGVDDARVHVEHFYVDGPPPELTRTEPEVSGATSGLTVVLDGRTTVSTMARDQSVLDAAQGVRSDLPFACKGGVCGTCRARVTDGAVEMRRNYALEPDEVDRGFVLTCQSHPTGAALTVDFDA